MLFARVINETVIELFNTPINFGIEQCFVPEIASQFIPCMDGVQPGWKYINGEFFPLIQSEIIEE